MSAQSPRLTQAPDAVEIVRCITTGATTAEAVMTDCLTRIAERDGEVGAFEAIDHDRALEAARQADKTEPSGPLHGVPFAIKDIIDTLDFPTTWGSPIYAGNVAPRNASCVEHFICAGAIPIGKTVTTELAYFSPGKTANPHNLAHTPGGSSSGSAAAVADGMVPLAFGSQTAGSMIRPAAYCGVAGYKASLGSIDLQGVMGLSSSLDALGVLARSVRDLALARTVLAGGGVDHSNTFTDNPPRIALMRGPHWTDGSIEMRDVCQRAMSVLADGGAQTGELAHPDIFDDLTDAQKTVMAFETARARIFEYNRHCDRLSPQFTALVEDGLAIERPAYEAALRTRDTAARMLEPLLMDVNAILAPSAPGEAPEGLSATGDPLFSRGWNLLGVPCVSVPFCRGPNGLPLSIQLIGPHGDDDRVLAVADWTQKCLDAAA